MKELKTSEAQRKATKKWEQNNPEAKRYLRARSNARTFARMYAKTIEEVEELVEIFKNENIKGEKIMKNLVKIYNLKVEIENGIDVEENIEELKELLKGADLNKEVTVHYCEASDTYFYEGNITENWEKLLEGNWNGNRYAAHVDDDDMYSTSVYEWLTNENNDDIIEAIEEIDPEFKAEEKMSAYLTLKDLVDKKGYLKAAMIDDRYLVSENEIDRISDWLDDHEDEEAEGEIKATDILKNEEVKFLIKADQRENFVNDGGLKACEVELIK